MPEITIETKFKIGQKVFYVSVSNKAQDKCSQCGGWDFRQAKNIYHIYEAEITFILISYYNTNSYEVSYQGKDDNGYIHLDELFETRELAEQYIKNKLKEMGQ